MTPASEGNVLLVDAIGRADGSRFGQVVRVFVFIGPGSGGLIQPFFILFPPDDAGTCEGDINGDGTVNGADLGLLLGAFGPCVK